ncbi:DUF3143 domain-containing protein [Leptolyngbya sp. PCC 6406]|uniref:DUF3143 domain-containing protein n=1 Tax=Leptolyngbya sp. PCC 6406 TaxID=1173264 RepID=UPI0002ACD185|nr:DUF3143 domain-containing protein [Leptolyngbya sp. PCC 6406]
MALPSVQTPLYNHPLPEIEQWLRDHGCQQDADDLHRWHLDTPDWQADIVLEIDALVVLYLCADGQGQDVQRVFKYSLSRQDLDEAIFSGP